MKNVEKLEEFSEKYDKTSLKLNKNDKKSLKMMNDNDEKSLNLKKYDNMSYNSKKFDKKSAKKKNFDKKSAKKKSFDKKRFKFDKTRRKIDKIRKKIGEKFDRISTKFDNFFVKILPKSARRRSEIVVILLTLFLAGFGCLMVYSASSYGAKYHYGNEFFFLFKQIFGLVLGVCGMVFFALVDYHVLKKFRYLILAVAVILLLLVFVPGLGVESYGARRWVSILGVSIQPSEVAKFALIIFLAWYFSENHDKIKTFKGLIPALCVAGVLCVLVIIEPSMSVTMCMGAVTLFMLIIGGMSKKHTLIFSGCAVAAVPVLIAAEPYRLRRLFAFLDPWASPQGDGFQLIQSLYSLGAGSWFGVGLFNSRQKFLFLPFAESDFIFSIIGEEFGLVGCVLLMGIYLILVMQLIKIGLSAADRFGCLLACGIGILIAVQTFLNIAVVTGSIPPTGLPLPFISSGGTSLAVFMSGIGIAISVSRNAGSGAKRSR